MPDMKKFRGQPPLRVAIKACWRLAQKARLLSRLLYHRALVGVFFRHIGSGTRFWGRVRFGSAEGNISLGKRCDIGHEVFFSATRGSEIEIGDNCAFNTGCHIVAMRGIRIGRNTTLGEYCSIRDQNHRLEAGGSALASILEYYCSVRDRGQSGRGVDKPGVNQDYTGAPIRIGDNVWMARGVFIGAGVEIGDGCIIGANSVVTKSVAPFSVVSGAPARVITTRKRQCTTSPPSAL
jgi:acetyltransferase-like isoleucine patch superfamily enzyme